MLVINKVLLTNRAYCIMLTGRAITGFAALLRVRTLTQGTIKSLTTTAAITIRSFKQLALSSMFSERVKQLLAEHKVVLTPNNRKEDSVRALIVTLVEHNISTTDPEFLEFMGDAFNPNAYEIYSSSQVPTNEDCRVLEVRQPHTIHTIADEALKRSKELKALVDSSGNLAPVFDVVREDVVKATALKSQLLDKALTVGFNGMSKEEMVMLIKLRDLIENDNEMLERVSRKEKEQDEMFESDDNESDSNDNSGSERSIL